MTAVLAIPKSPQLTGLSQTQAQVKPANDNCQLHLVNSENVAPFATNYTAYYSSHRVQTTDAAGVTTLTYNDGYGGPGRGQPLYIFQYAPETVQTILYRNEWGEMTRLRQLGTSADGINMDESRYYYYDDQRRLCRYREDEGGDTLYAYDAVGQMTSYQKGLAAGSICAAPSGIDMVSLGYDVLGRPTTTDFADINTPDMTRSYDANGNLKTVRRGAGADLIRWTYYYNEINLLNYEYLDVDGRNYDAYYGFNTAGHRVFRILPSNRYLDETRDGLGRLTSVAGSGGGTSYASNISYHPSGAIAGATYGNGQVFSQTLNARLQPSHLLSQLGGNTALDLTYTYDVRGKVTNILNGAITGDNRTYAYDGIGRLTSSSGPWGSGAYSYDALGNIRTKTEGGRALVMAYDSKNRLVSHTDTGGPNRTLNYDNRGNVTQLGGLFFTYDKSDQPTYISGTASGTYRYDGHNRRVKAVVDGKTIYNVYDASGTLVHIDAVTDGKKTDYIGKFVRIKTENGTDTPTYLHMDHLGSAQTGTSQNGTVAWREQYMPFGETMTNPLGNADLAGYTGHIKDSATGLNYMQARYYDPLIGRFLSIDPINFTPDMPFMFNRYTYVNNDPVNATDPTGMVLKYELRNGGSGADLAASLAYLAASPTSVRQINRLIRSVNTYTIIVDPNRSQSMYNPKLKYIL